MSKLSKDYLHRKLMEDADKVLDAAQDMYCPKIGHKLKKVTRDQMVSALVLLDKVKDVLKIN